MMGRVLKILLTLLFVWSFCCGPTAWGQEKPASSDDSPLAASPLSRPTDPETRERGELSAGSPDLSDINPVSPARPQADSPISADDLILEDVVITGPEKKKSPKSKRRVKARAPKPVPGPEPAPAPVSTPLPEPAESAGATAMRDSLVTSPGAGPGGAGPAGTGPAAGQASGQSGGPAAGGPASLQGVTPVRTGDVRPEYTPSFYSRIERERFDGKMDDLAEVIEKEAGVQVRQSGGLGSFSEVSLRGSDSAQVMIYLDGILLNDASGGGVDLSNIALADVEAIEVYRGTTPANFGKASIGGAINIRTLSAKKGLKASVGAGVGSFYTKKIFGFLNHKPGKGDYVLSADYLGSDNNFEFLNNKGTDLNPDDDVWEERQNAQFYQYNLMGKAGYDLSPDFRIDFLNQYFFKHQGLPNWTNQIACNASLKTRRNIAALKLTGNDLSPLHLNTSLKLSYTWKEETYDDRQGYIGLGQQYSRYTTLRYGGNVFVEWPTDHNILSLSSELFREDYKPRDLTDLTRPLTSTRDYWSTVVQDNLIFFGRRVVLTPALRYTTINDQLKSGVGNYGDVLEGTSRYESYVTPQCGLKIKPLSWLTLKGNWARYVREPSFFELFGDRGFFLGNDELVAEEGTNWDVGLELDWSTRNFWLNRITFNLARFGSEVDHLITRVYDSRGVGRSVNISEASISGTEAGLVVDFMKHFTFTGNATQQDTENHSQIPINDGKYLPGRFRYAYLAKMEAKWRGFKAYGEYIREEGRYYDTANLVEAKPKEEYNAGISYLWKSILFSLDIKNLKDRQYEDYHRYPLPGRAFYFTVKYTY